MPSFSTPSLVLMLSIIGLSNTTMPILNVFAYSHSPCRHACKDSSVSGVLPLISNELNLSSDSAVRSASFNNLPTKTLPARSFTSVAYSPSITCFTASARLYFAISLPGFFSNSLRCFTISAIIFWSFVVRYFPGMKNSAKNAKLLARAWSWFLSSCWSLDIKALMLVNTFKAAFSIVRKVNARIAGETVKSLITLIIEPCLKSKLRGLRPPIFSAKNLPMLEEGADWKRAIVGPSHSPIFAILSGETRKIYRPLSMLAGSFSWPKRSPIYPNAGPVRPKCRAPFKEYIGISVNAFSALDHLVNISFIFAKVSVPGITAFSAASPPLMNFIPYPVHFMPLINAANTTPAAKLHKTSFVLNCPPFIVVSIKLSPTNPMPALETRVISFNSSLENVFKVSPMWLEINFTKLVEDSPVLNLLAKFNKGFIAFPNIAPIEGIRTPIFTESHTIEVNSAALGSFPPLMTKYRLKLIASAPSAILPAPLKNAFSIRAFPICFAIIVFVASWPAFLTPPITAGPTP